MLTVTPIHHLPFLEWLNNARRANQNAEYLLAYDQAMSGLEEYPNNPQLGFQAVLALARSGATGRAAETFQLLGLEGNKDEDIASLEARILKDRFFSSADHQEADIAGQSASCYEMVFLATGGYYPAINAASMWLFAGDRERSAKLAEEVLQICRKHGDQQVDEIYWLRATQAEALLLLEDLHGAEEQLKIIVSLQQLHLSDLVSTRTQLQRISRFLGLYPTFIDLLKLPGVIHYTGHMITPRGEKGRFAAESEARVAGEIQQQLERLNVGFGYGSLACGGDILVAEALLQRGAELHLVFPFELEDFEQTSVLGGGLGWQQRFRRCKKRAHSVTFASEDGYLGDSMIFAYTSRIAMGLARIQAQNLNTAAHQLAIWDGQENEGVAGTAADIACWREHGFISHLIDAGPPATGISPPATSWQKKEAKRTLAPVLFTDMKGFSHFREEEIMVFIDEVMGSLAKVINRHQEGILYRNTWGDAIFLVFADVATAIECVLELQARLWQLPLAEMGLPADTGMRMAMHAGPVFEGFDPILSKKAFFGSTLTRAARMEPVTPVGEIYVSGAFAALAVFEDLKGVRCEYVGHMPTAKSYGCMRMFHLKKTV